MKKLGAGIMLYRHGPKGVEIFLVHPGGPFWARKDAWGIPKGDAKDGEELGAVAKREFEEEVGSAVPAGDWLELGQVKRSDGRLVSAWAVEGNMDADSLRSNMAQVEWPPKSGNMIEIPEVDKAEWMPLPKALKKIHAYQLPFVEALAAKLGQNIETVKAPEQATLL